MAFYYRMSLKEFFEYMPVDEWATWVAFSECEPFGSNEEQYRFAKVVLSNCASGLSPMWVNPKEIFPNYYDFILNSDPAYRAKELEARLLARTKPENLPKN